MGLGGRWWGDDVWLSWGWSTTREWLIVTRHSPLTFFGSAPRPKEWVRHSAGSLMPSFQWGHTCQRVHLASLSRGCYAASSVNNMLHNFGVPCLHARPARSPYQAVQSPGTIPHPSATSGQFWYMESGLTCCATSDPCQHTAVQSIFWLRGCKTSTQVVLLLLSVVLSHLTGNSH